MTNTAMLNGYPRVGRRSYEHRAVAERALGRPLKATEIVHHFDGNRLNNAPNNLVICPDQAYHLLLHTRQRALEACGDADWRQCQICKRWDAQSALVIYPKGSTEHRACQAALRRALTMEKRT